MGNVNEHGNEISVQTYSLENAVNNFDLKDCDSHDSEVILNWIHDNFDREGFKVSLLYRYIKFFNFNSNIPCSNMFIGSCMRELINVITRDYNFLDQEEIHKHIYQTFCDKFENNEFAKLCKINDIPFSLTKNFKCDEEIILGYLGFSEALKFKLFLSNYISQEGKNFKKYIENIAKELKEVKDDLHNDAHFGNSGIDYNDKIMKLDSILSKCINDESYFTSKLKIDLIIKNDNPDNVDIDSLLLDLNKYHRLKYDFFNKIRNKEWLNKFKGKKLFSSLELTDGIAFNYLLNQLETDNKSKAISEIISVLKLENIANYRIKERVIIKISKLDNLTKNDYNKILNPFTGEESIHVSNEDLLLTNKKLLENESYEEFGIFNGYLMKCSKDYSILDVYTFKKYFDSLLSLNNINANKKIIELILESNVINLDSLDSIGLYDDLEFLNHAYKLYPYLLYKCVLSVIKIENYDSDVWSTLNVKNTTLFKAKCKVLIDKFNQDEAIKFIESPEVIKEYIKDSYNKGIFLKLVHDVFSNIDDSSQKLSVINKLNLLFKKEQSLFSMVLSSAKDFIPAEFSHELLNESRDFDETLYTNKTRGGFVSNISPITYDEFKLLSTDEKIKRINEYKNYFGEEKSEYLINSVLSTNIKGLLKDFDKYVKEDIKNILSNLNEWEKLQDNEFLDSILKGAKEKILDLNSREREILVKFMINSCSKLNLSEIFSTLNMISQNNLLTVNLISLIDTLFDEILENRDGLESYSVYSPGSDGYNNILNKIYNDNNMKIVEEYIIFSLSIKRNKLAGDDFTKLESLLDSLESEDCLCYLLAIYFSNLLFLTPEWLGKNIDELFNNKEQNIDKFYIFLITYLKYIRTVGDKGIYTKLSKELYWVIDNISIKPSFDFSDDVYIYLGQLMPYLYKFEFFDYSMVVNDDRVFMGVLDTLTDLISNGKRISKQRCKKFINAKDLKNINIKRLSAVQRKLMKWYTEDLSKLQYDDWIILQVNKLIKINPSEFYEGGSFYKIVNENISENNIEKILEIYYSIMYAYFNISSENYKSLYGIDNNIEYFIKQSPKYKEFLISNNTLKTILNDLVEYYQRYLDDSGKDDNLLSYRLS